MVRQKEELKVYLFIHYVTGTSIYVALAFQHHLQVIQNELFLAYVYYHCYLDFNTAELPHDEARSWADKLY